MYNALRSLVFCCVSAAVAGFQHHQVMLVNDPHINRFWLLWWDIAAVQVGAAAGWVICYYLLFWTRTATENTQRWGGHHG